MTLYDGVTVLLPPRYYGSIGWYAVMAAHGGCKVDYDMPFNKRMKEVHRCDIVDTHGVLSLTMPVEKPVAGTGRLSWRDIGVSSHGEWWNVHRVSFESAYGRTPFFEFYIDRFNQVLHRGVVETFPRVSDIDSFIDATVRDILGIGPDEEPAGKVRDMRQFDFKSIGCNPYYQVRADKLGFTAGLSILDLIFNLGPESPLYLRDLIRSDRQIGCLGISE